jgi:hypothetical protein
MSGITTSNFGSLSLSAPGKRVCFWGAPTDSRRPGDNFVEQLAASGGNTGNMFIGHGLYNNLRCEAKSYHPGFHTLPPERFHEHYDLVIIPASNFVNTTSDLALHYNYFSKTNVSLVCFGLGSQLLPNQDVILQPGTERFLRLISERSGSIGVRGVFTAEALWKMGIRNVSVIGCPSLFNLKAAQLERLCQTPATLEKVGVNFSNNVRRHGLNPIAMKASEDDLFQRVIRENSFYIVQNEIPELELLAARAAGNTDAFTGPLERICASFAVSPSRDDVRQYLLQRLRVFFNVDEWLSSTATMTSSVGSRFHGNIAAILSGIPALFLVHDMRTLELCEFFRLPHVLIDCPMDAEAVLEQLVSADYQPFKAQMARAQTEWRLFAARNGLDVVAEPS